MYKTRILITSVIFLIVSSVGLFAQRNGTLTGKVCDVQGNPVPGAAVIAKSTNNGTVTSEDGSFSIQLVVNEHILVSSLGYKDKEITVPNFSPLNVVLEEDTQLLDEILVIGYGTQSRKTLTSSISKMDGAKLTDIPASTVGDALKGKIPGLRVSTSNALSGETPRFMIRGGSSISMSNDPIYIVDGALREDMNGINTNDIESIEVLKDAASAGIYGARASNGVILVTTKKGSASNGIQLTVDSQVGFQTPSTKWDILNSRDYLNYIRPAIAEALANDKEHPASTLLSGPNAYGTGNTSSKSIYSTRYLDWGGVVPDGYSWMADPVDPTKVIIFQDNDWQSQWFSTALWHKEYVGVNGSSDRVRYSASASYMGDDGIVSSSDYNVFTMHGSTSFKITDRLEAGATFDMSRQRKHIPVDNYYQCIGRGLIAAPTAMEKNLDGEWNQLVSTNKNAHSPAWYKRFYSRQNSTSRQSGAFNLKWTLFDGLVFNALYNRFEQHYEGSYYTYGERDGVINSVTSSRPMTQTRTSTTRDTFTALFAFDKTFRNSHHLSSTVGYEYMKQAYSYLQAKSSGSVSDDVPVLQSGTNFEATNKDEHQAMMSAFARVGYDFKQRYIVSGSIRADGSSKFASGHRWGYFPAASAAWLVSEEPFWDNLKQTVNTFKLRASYGQTGNNGIGLYDTYGAFTSGSYGSLPTMTPSKMQNSSMKWETTTQLDAGIDLSFLNDRIRFIFDYYNKVTSDMLFSITLPDTSPYSCVMANVGSARFYGFEVELHSENISTRNFSWSTDLTYAFSKNKVLSLPDEYMYDIVDEDGHVTGDKGWRIGGYTMSESGYRFGGTAVGEPLGRIYGYKVSHIIKTQEEADNALYDAESKGFRVSDGKRVTGRKDIGDYEWCNRKGSAVDEKGNEIINSEDMFYLGNVVPHSVGGINNTLRWKGLTFNIYLDYAIGHSIINGQKTQLLKNTMGDCNSMLGSIVYDCWTPENPDAKYARYTPNDSDWGNRNWRGNSSFMTERADYLCVRDVSLFYELPKKWVEPLKMQKVTVGVSGNTLYYFTGVTGAISPESGISSDNSADMYTAMSTNNNSSSDTGNLMPNARKVIFSLKLVF